MHLNEQKINQRILKVRRERFTQAAAHVRG